MAVWTVNTTADDGSVDTDNHVGSLRGCIGAAASGDTIVFDSSLKEGDVVTILLSSVLSCNRSLTINGGSHTGSGATLQTRVVLDGQNSTAILHQPSSAVVLSIFNITFKNAYTINSNTPGGGIKISSTSNSANLIEYCVFDTCHAYYGGGFANNGTTGVCEISNCRFVNCSSEYNGGAVYLTNSCQTTLNNCYFTNNSVAHNSRGLDVYNRSTNTQYINGGEFLSADSIYNFTNVTDIVLSGTITCSGFTLTSVATVTFSGVDSILAVTTTASVGSATFTAAANSTGYAAFPSGTDTSAATFTGVKTTTYGANVTSVAASIYEDVATIDVTATDSAIPYLVEGSSDDGATWQTLTLVEKQTVLASSKAYKFRTFDGRFVYSDDVPRVYYYNGAPTAGSFTAAADWALDEDRAIVCSDAPTIKNGVFYCI